MLPLFLLLFAAAPADVVVMPAIEISRGSSRAPDEQPVRAIQLTAFAIDRTEVSIDAFEHFVRAAWNDATVWSEDGRVWRDASGRGAGRDMREAGREGNHPVVAVSWFEADAYCRWNGGKLPTEAQWERAACDGGAGPFPWGTEQREGVRWATKSVNFGEIRINTAPVDEDVSSEPMGLRHMVGNVWEWTADWYDRDAYASGPSIDPVGPDTGRWKTIRGGSFSNLPSYSTCTHREPAEPNDVRLTVGFRCVYSSH